MKPVLVDTNIVSILFKLDHALRPSCVALLLDHQIFVSFMTRAELLLWPEANDWGPRRRLALRNLLADYTTLCPDAETCERWVDISSRNRKSGRPMGAGDIWIAATALHWSMPLVTVNHRDFDHLAGLTLVPVR